MKHTFRTLLGLAFIVFVFSGCPNPSGPEIPEGAKVEFVWDIDYKVPDTIWSSDSAVYSLFYSYFSGLRQDKSGNWVFDYPKGYDKDTYSKLYANKECFKELCEKAFEEALGTKYYKEGTSIDLTKWTSEARDLTVITSDGKTAYVRLYFLAEDIGKTDYDKTIYESYLDYLKKNSFDEIEVYNQDIKVYVYWDYFYK